MSVSNADTQAGSHKCMRAHILSAPCARESEMSELQILIQEIARIALEDEATTQRIAHELGETEEKLQRVAGYLNSLLDPTNPQE